MGAGIGNVLECMENRTTNKNAVEENDASQQRIVELENDNHE